MKEEQLKTAQDAVKATADKEGVSIDVIRMEMMAAIAEGMRSEDPKAQEMWKSIPCKGEVPEPEELIAWLAEQVKERMES